MRAWPVQDAKARFSEFLEASLTQGPQLVTRRGVEAAVLVPVAQWRRLQEGAQRSLKELLLAAEPRVERLAPARRRRRHRAPVSFD
jgi:prevent-host-death family protein